MIEVKRVLPIFILILLPCPTTATVSFNAWLSVDRLVFTVGKPVFINIYVNNTGDQSDKYNLTNFTVNVGNPNLVIVTPLRNVTEEVLPREVATIPVKINILYAFKEPGASIKFKVASVTDPTIHRYLTLSISSGIPESLSEINNFYLFLVILFSFLLLFMELKR